MIHYETEEFGNISCGPAHFLKIKLVKFRDFMNVFKMHIDIRVYVKYVETNRICSTRKGLVIPTRFIIPIFNTLQDMPSDLPDEEWHTFAKFPNRMSAEIHVSTTRAGLDIREWLTESPNGYEGYTHRGVRITYDLKENVCNMLLAVNERVVEIEKTKGIVADTELDKIKKID